MAGKRSNYEIGLQFTADTKQAKAEIQKLQQTFNSLAFDSKKLGIGEASQAATELAANLQSAINVDTGRLNLSTFQKNLQQSGRSLEDYQRMLGTLGATGNEAFSKLSTAILQAEVPLTKTNKLFSNLWYSFKQTAKYQFTSSIYRGLISGIQSAYQYAQDLNESLNNIRIVTQQSTDQMAKFAEQANKAAQSLSVSTIEYTKGALIYYQQGLDDEAVKTRTNVTMKLANASGVSAETASQQLTAIWNNFAKGTDNLEYFADAITALGASTASSTSEIAEGLEKFAGIANSVGLSYEYAAAALATVTATTRQSADVVGTAFKTLFARIQDLEVGETLEDGTTLGKYSQALAAIGVNIKDANGDLKDMDVILDEMGSKWSTLSRDMQVAVAQTVAGTRQYTQMITLMENWDFFKENVSTASESEGTLQKQQDTYAEGWEAAGKRVKAAAESIWQSLINDEFFINLLNSAEKVLNFLDSFIENLGGLKGILLTVGAIVTTVFQQQIVNGIQHAIARIQDFFGITQAKALILQKQVLELNRGNYVAPDNDNPSALSAQSGQVTQNVLESNYNARKKILNLMSTATDYQKKYYQYLLDEMAILEKITIQRDKDINKLDEEILKTDKFFNVKKSVVENSFNQEVRLLENGGNELYSQSAQFSQLGVIDGKTYKKNVEDIARSFAEDNSLPEALREQAKQLENFAHDNRSAAKDVQVEVDNFTQAVEQHTQKMKDLGVSGAKNNETKVIRAKNQFTKAVAFDETVNNMSANLPTNKEGMESYVEQLRSMSNESATLKKKLEGTFKVWDESGHSIEDFIKVLKDAKQVSSDFSDTTKQKLTGALEATTEYTDRSTESIRENVQELETQTRTQQRLANEQLLVAKQQAAELDARISKVGASAQSGLNNLTSLASAVMSVTSAVTSFKNGLQTLNKVGATSEEKLSAITSLASGLMMGLMGLNAATKLLKDSTLLHTLATKLQAAATVKWGEANIFANSTMLPLLASIGIFLVAAAAIVAVIILISNNLNKEAIEAEKAAKKVEELSKAYDEAKESAKEFKDSITGYNEAIKELEELTEGTEEYKEKVKEANEEAQKIIDQYKEKTGKQLAYQFDISSGRIVIDPKELEKAKIQIDSKELKAANELLAAKIDANEKANRAELVKLTRNSNTQNAIEELANIYQHNGHNVDRALQTIGEDQTRLIKSVNQSQLYDYLENVVGRELDNIEQSKKISSGLSKFNQDYLDRVQDEELKKFLQNYLGTKQVERQIQQSKEQNKIRESGDINDYINYAQKHGEQTVEQIEERGKQYGASIISGLFDYIASQLGIDSFEIETEGDIQTAKQFITDFIEENFGALSQQERDDLSAILNKFLDTQSNIVGYTDEDKKAILSNNAILLDKIFSLLPQNLISSLPQNLQNAINESDLTKIVNEQNKILEQQDQQNANTLLDTFSPLFSGNKSNLTSFLNNLISGYFDPSGFTLNGMKNFDVNTIDENMARALGYSYIEKDEEGNEREVIRLEDLIEDINKYRELQQKEFAKINSSLYGEVRKYLEDYGDVNIAQYEKIKTGLTDAFVKGGQEGLDKLNKILKGQKDPVGIIDALNDIDWRTANFNEVYKQLKDLGYNINRTDFDELAKQFKEIEENSWRLTASLEELFEQFKKIKDITDKLTFGATISDEDYQKYIKDKDEFKNKFVWTINGWMYIGEEYAGKDKALIENSDIKQIREDYAKAREDAAKISEKDLKLSDTELAYQYFGGAYYNPISGEVEYKEGYGGRSSINKTALSMADISEEALKDALATPQLEESKKIISAYADAIRELYETSEKYADKNVLTMAVESQYKSVDKLIDKWDDLKETWGDTLTDDVATQLIKIATINEAVAKGIDKDELIDYVKWLRESNAQLAENEELLYQVAVANKIAQKAFKETVSSYEANIEALKNDAPDSETYLKALNNLRQNLADMLSISIEELAGLDASFFTDKEIVELYDAIAKGDEKSLQLLTANAMVRAGQVIEAEKDIYIEFLAFMATNPGQAEIDVWYKEHNKPSFLKKNADGTYTRTVAGDAAGLEYDRLGRIASQGSIFDYSAYKGNLDKNKGKSSKPKELEDELDRYHHIKKVLEDIERELERVAKVKDRAYGAQHLKYLEQEISYLEEEVGLQDQYISQIEGYLGKDRGLIAAYGAQFDEYGNISNYDEMFAANFAKYANAEDSTNWENFKKALSKYEETMDLWQDEVEKRADLIREILDKKLEGISYKVEIEVALSDREIKLLEHQLNRLDEAAYDTAAALANIGQQFEKTQDKIDSVTDGIVETLKTIPGITDERIAAYLAGDGSALDGLDIEQGQIDLLEEYSDQLLELSDTLKELHDKALEQVSAAFDAWNEKIEDHIAKFEHLNNVISNYEEIIGLLGQSNLGITNEFMREMRGQRIANLQGELDTRTRVKDNLAEELAQARQKAAEAASDAEREDWEKVADDIEKRLEEATESWQEAWIAALQANKEAFEQTMQEIVDSFSNYENELKRYDAEQDRYLETYQQAYELSKLTRDIQNSINDQDSIRAKQELQKLETKINDIKKSGRQISQDELTLLQKEYELRLAEIALEDAQNAKSMVRLSRDNEGNWGYVYTADQDKIAEAEQKYEDKLYEYMRQADTMAESASRAILTLNREMAEALAALDVNAEDYEEQVAAITKFYGDQIAYYAEQYNISVDAIETVAKESAARYKPEVVDIIKSENSGLQTNFEETVLAIIGHFGSMDTAVSEVMGGIQTTYDETIAAFQEYQRQNQETCELAGTDIEHMAQFISGQFTDIQTSAEEVVGHTQELTTGMKTELDKVLTELGTFASKYSEQVGMADTAATGLSGALIELEETLQALSGDSLKTLQKLVDDVTTMAQAVKEAGQAVGDAVDGMSTNPKPGVDISYKIKIEGEYDPRFGESGVWAGLLGQERNPKNNKGDAKTSLQTQMYDGARVSMYGTGGYTGEWGDTAKLAGLHEKELVLNQTDTQNILDAVSLIRKMTAGTAQLSSGLGNIGAGLNNLNINPGTMDQNVQISASFPNVSNHYEIEEALNNLVNKASQYAFRPVYT